MHTVKKKPLLMVILFSVMLILNTTSLSATNRMSAHKAFADNCYDSNGNYVCSDMSDGSSNSDSGDQSSDGNTGADSSDGSGDSGSDSGDSPIGENSGDSSNSNPNQGLTDSEQDNTGNSNTQDAASDSESDSDLTTNDNKIQTENGPNSKPVADAGPDLEVDEGDRVVLDGSSSKDNDGSISTYSWNQIDGNPNVDLNDADSSTASFTAPNVDSNQQLVFHLSVSDNDGSTDGDSVSVMVRDVNSGANQEDGQKTAQSESDSKGSEVTPDDQNIPTENNQSIPNEQEQINPGQTVLSKPDQVQENENISNSRETSISPPSCTENQTECTRGQEPGEVDCMDSKFANASECNTSPPTTPCAENVTLCNPPESPPASCVNNSTEEGCNLVEMPPNPCNGNVTGVECNTPSNPCNGNVTGVECNTPSNPCTGNVTGVECNTPSNPCTGNVTGGSTNNQTDCNPLPECPVNMTATIECQQPRKNIPPVADAGKDQQVEEGSQVILDGSKSYDPDGNITSYSWVQDSGNSSIIIVDADRSSANFMAPQVDNDSKIRVKLTITDNGSDTNTDYADILIKNTNSTITPPLIGKLTLDKIPDEINAGSIYVFSGRLQIAGASTFNNSYIQIRSSDNNSDNEILSFNTVDSGGRFVAEWTAVPRDSMYNVYAAYQDEAGHTLNSDIQSFQVRQSNVTLEGQSSSDLRGPYIPIIFNDYKKSVLNVYVVANDASSLPYVSTAVKAIKHWSDVLKNRSNNSNAWKFNILTSRDFPSSQVNNYPINVLVNLDHKNDQSECRKFGGCAHITWLDRLLNGHIIVRVFTGSGTQKFSEGWVSYITSHEFGHALGLGHAWHEGKISDRTADMMCSSDYRYYLFGLIGIGEVPETCDTHADVFKDHNTPTEFDIRAVIYSYGKDGFQPPNLKLTGNDIYVCQPLPCESPNQTVKPNLPTNPINPNPPNNPPNDNKEQVKKKTTTIITKTTEVKPKVVPYFSNYGLVGKIGSFGRGPGQFNHPASVAADPNGQRFYISDLDNNRIQVLDADGHFITEWGTLGGGKDQFDGPGAVAVDDAHKLVFVSDIRNNRIEKFDIQGKYLGQWGNLGRSEGQFDHPGDIALDPEEEKLYVTDIYNNRIQAFYYDGNFIGSWGTFGLDNGQFNRPAGITMDTKANLVYVTDRQNHRIQVFDDQGKFVAKWDVSDITGGPVKPRDIVIDPSGHVYVVDKVKSEIDVFGTSPSIQKTLDKKTTTTTTTKTIKKSDTSSTDSASGYTLSMNFNDFDHANYKGKTTVTIKNSATHEVLGKKTFDFGKINDGSFDCCKGAMTFDRKDSKTGDKLTLDAVDSGKNGGSVSGYELKFDIQNHKYKLNISLDEFGCGDCG